MVKKIVLFVVIVAFLVGLYLFFMYGKRGREEVLFSDCIDGDTAWFLVNGVKTKVRFLGIDAPEITYENDKIVSSSYYGIEAKEFVCQYLKEANHIYLEYDPFSDRYDKYNRLLAWVFVDDINFNELLVRRGYASVRYVYQDYVYVDDLCIAQKNAYEEKCGIWQKEFSSYSKNYCVKNKGGI